MRINFICPTTRDSFMPDTHIALLVIITCMNVRIIDKKAIGCWVDAPSLATLRDFPNSNLDKNPKGPIFGPNLVLNERE